MEAFDDTDTFAYIAHDGAEQVKTTAAASKLLMPDDVAPIAGDARKRLATTSDEIAAVAAAEAAVEEARKLVAPAPPVKALQPIDADAPAETIAPYVEYQKDSMSASVYDYVIRVKEYQDEHGRQFYEFDNGRSKPLLACVFHTTAGYLVSLNGVVAPLASFQSIVFARTAPAKVGKEAKRAASRTTSDLRGSLPVGDEKVLCTLTDGQQLTIPNTTVQHVMMALQRLAPPATRVETEQAEAEAEHVGPLRRLWRWLY